MCCTTGPILLFERCDLGRLRDWLAAQPQVTDDLQDKMITLSIQIARAMKHLHANKVSTSGLLIYIYALLHCAE